MEKGKKIEVVEESGRRVQVGVVRNNIFYKKVKESDHLYKLLDAWGLDKTVFEKVVMGCTEIRILEEESGKVYSCHPKMWAQNGVEKEHRPHGRQTFLSREFFKIEDKKSSDAEKLKNFLAARKK